MYHPTTRVLTILELLQAHPQLSGAELAARLEVDRRTVRRYIAMLEDLGIPIEAERGPHGGYRLRPGFKLPPLMFTDDEALVVTLGLLAARRYGLPADPHAIAGALAKIERVLPEQLRARIQAMPSVVALGPPSTTPPPRGAIMRAISTAAAQRRRVRLRYSSYGGETVRDFDPYGVVQHQERWYAVGWCHLRAAMRLFRLDKVQEVETREAHFTRPADFDPLAFVVASQAALPWGWQVELLLETTLEEAQQRMEPGSATFEPTADGVIVRMSVDSLDWLARRLLTLACPLVVRQPDELREALRYVADEALALAARRE